MALVRDTKTILLHGGMQDGVDDFLIESPNMELVENGVYDKEGVISKRHGFDELPAVPESSGLVGGASLIGIGTDSIAVYDEAAEDWSSVSANTVLSTTDLEFSTEFLPGASNFSHLTILGRRIVAYEVADNSERTLPEDGWETSVYVEVWSETGTRLSRTKYAGKKDPVLVTCPSNSAHLITAQSFSGPGAMNLYVCRVDPTYLQNFGPYSLGVTVNAIGGVYESAVIEAQGATRGGEGAQSLAEPLFSRFGQARANFKAASDGINSFVCYEDNDRKVKTFSFTLPLTTPIVSSRVTYASPTTSQKYRLLDLYAPSGSLVYLLSSRETATAATDADFQTTVNVASISKTTLASTASDSVFDVTAEDIYGGEENPADLFVQTGVPLIAVCGSVRTTSTRVYVGVSTVAYAARWVAGPADFSGAGFDLNNQYPTTFIYSGSLSTLSTSKRCELAGWRLSSGLYADGSQVDFCVQQWDVLYGGLAGRGTNVETFHLCGGLQSPYSNILCRVKSSGDRPIPIAVLGANRTMVTPTEESSYNTHLPRLEGATSSRTVLTPVISQAAQVSMPITLDNLYDFNQVLITRGIYRAEVSTVSLEVAVPASRAGDGVVLASGIPLYFDGGALGELTPLMAPLVLGAGFRDTVSGNAVGVAIDSDPDDVSLTIPTKVLAAYTDRQGTVHRSPPSRVFHILKVFLSSSGEDLLALVPEQAIDILPDISVALTTPITCLDSEGSLVYEVYTLSGGTYKLTASVPVDISEANGTVVVSLPLSDFEDESNQYTRTTRLLYTEGGVLPSDVVPSCSTFAVGGDRLVGVTDDPLATFIYSKPLTTGIAPEFPNAYYLPLGVGVGITAIASMDDKYVLFGQDSIRIVYGQGPSATGQGSGFAVMKLPSEVGCQDPQSVAAIPAGIMFRSRAGFYILGRDLSLNPVFGANDFLVGARVIAATNVPKSGEVRFLLAANGTPIDSDGPTPSSTRPATPKYGNAYRSGIALCYSYDANKWSTFSNYTGIASTLLNGEYVRLKDSTTAWKEADHWADPTGDNLLKLITPWIKLRNIQDYGQLWKATLLGRYLSTFVEDEAGDLDAGDIQVKVAYDYASADVDTKLWRASNELQPVERDSAVVSPGALRLQVRPERQKCSSVRFTIEEKNTADADSLTYRPGQGFEITSIDLELGMRPGTNTALPAKSKK